MTSDYALESLSEGDRIEMQADADAYDHFLASEELAALEAQALEAAQRAEEWAAFEEDMQTAYPWPSQQEIDEFEPRKAA